MSRTKVLLLRDVINLGEAGEVYTVAGGYARNYLIPRGYAMPATKGALKQADNIRQAAVRIQEFVGGRTWDDYEADALLRSAVERQFEIIGEALSQLSRLASDVSEKITNHRRIIAFRNILIHGYAVIDDRVVWDVVQKDLPVLDQEVRALLGQAG